MSVELPTDAELTRLADGVLLPGFTGVTLPDPLRARLAAGLGGVTLFAVNIGTPQQVRALTDDIYEANPNALIAIDEEGGDVTRLQWRAGSSYPGSLALGAAADVSLTEGVGAAIGADLAAAGINLNLAPSADVNCEPNNPVIGVRSFGSDSTLVAAHTAAWVRGHEAHGVAACVKHFPGHGDTAADSHHDLPRLNVPIQVLLSRELPPFTAAMAVGVRAMLTAHIVVSALDDVPATTSRRILNDLLRDELGFDGLVVTDALDMAGIAATMGAPEGAVRALIAGADALCLGMDHDEQASTDKIRNAIVGAVSEGRLSVDRLTDATRRMRALASWSRLNRVPSAGPDTALGLVAARRALRAEGRTKLAQPHPANDPQALPAERRTKLAQPHPANDPQTLHAERRTELAQPHPANDPQALHSAGRTELARPLRATGTAGQAIPAHDPPRVALPILAVDLPGVTNMAAGPDTPWGLGSALAAHHPDTSVVRAEPAQGLTEAQIADVLRQANDRELVVAVREIHREPRVHATVAALRKSRPDLVLVETGFPAEQTAREQLEQPGSGGYLRTFGGAAVCMQAAAEHLTD